jgi:hypothetical protein
MIEMQPTEMKRPWNPKESTERLTETENEVYLSVVNDVDKL